MQVQLLLSTLLLNIIQSYPESAFRTIDVIPFIESVCYHLLPLHQGQVALNQNVPKISVRPVYKDSRTQLHIKLSKQWNGLILGLRNSHFQLNNVKPKWKILKGNVKDMPCVADNFEFQILSHNDSNIQDILIDVPHHQNDKKMLKKLHFWATFVKGKQSFYGPHDYGNVIEIE